MQILKKYLAYWRIQIVTKESVNITTVLKNPQ